MVLTLVLLGSVAIASGCSGGDLATVTINTGFHEQAVTKPPTLFNRIIAYIPLIQKAYAEPWDGYALDITVSGAGMDTFTKIVPSDTGILTFEVPSGPGRTFTAVAYSDGYRAYGGIVTRDLAPGENTTIPIQMGLLPNRPTIQSIDQFSYAALTIQSTNGDVYRIYRTRAYTQDEYNGGLLDSAAYYPIGSALPGSPTTYNDSTVIAFRYYRYKVSALNQFGESEIGGSSAGMDYYQYFHC